MREPRQRPHPIRAKDVRPPRILVRPVACDLRPRCARDLWLDRLRRKDRRRIQEKAVRCRRCRHRRRTRPPAGRCAASARARRLPARERGSPRRRWPCRSARPSRPRAPSTLVRYPAGQAVRTQGAAPISAVPQWAAVTGRLTAFESVGLATRRTEGLTAECRVPLGCAWRCRAQPARRVPGSRLPRATRWRSCRRSVRRPC